MPKLRKTLGDIRSQTCRRLMQVMDTQSQATLAKWAIEYAQDRYLSICAQVCPELVQIVSVCAACAKEGKGAAHRKQELRKAAALARACTGAETQAAARAVAVACATLQTPSNALGFLFYGAAAVAYSEGGLQLGQAEYDAMAAEELENACRSLCDCAVEGEPSPVKINWNC